MIERKDKTIGSVGVRLAISILLLGWLLHKTDLNSLARAFRHIDWTLLLGAQICVFGCVFLATYRWDYVIKAMGVRIPYFGLLKSNLVGMFFNLYTPSNIGQDAVRVIDFKTAGDSTAVGAASVMVERMLGLLAILVFAVATYPFAAKHLPDMRVIQIAVVFLSGCLLAMFLMLYAPVARPLGRFASKFLPIKLESWLREFHGTMRRMITNPRAMLAAFIAALAFQLMVIVANYFIAKALGVQLSLTVHMLVVPLVLLVTSIPLSINGIGLREWAYVNLWGAFGVAKEQAMLASLVFLAAWIVVGFVGLITYLNRRQVLIAKPAPETR